jgi:hypothetical protein
MHQIEPPTDDMQVRKSQIGRKLRQFIAMMAWFVTLALSGLVFVGIIAGIGVIVAAAWWTFLQGWGVVFS